MQDQNALKKVAGLKYLDAGDPSSDKKIVICHGYGANAFDLFPLHHELAQKTPVHWIFPQGPLSVPIAPGFSGQAWFSIRAEALQLAAATGQPLDFSKIRPPGMTAATDQLLQFLQALNVNPSSSIIGGFSQGSMLALDALLKTQLRWAGLMLYSSTLTDADNWSGLARQISDQKFFQSHGERDELLPFGEALRLKILLEDCGWDGSWFEFTGGHEIPYQVLTQSKSFIQEVLKD